MRRAFLTEHDAFVAALSTAKARRRRPEAPPRSPS
jgi:hypothetical protein